VAAIFYAGPAASQKPTFRSRTDLVVLSVTVLGEDDGHAVALPVEAFTVRENGRPRPIIQFSAGSVPIRVVAVVDASGSMSGERFRFAREAVLRLFDQLGPDDQLLVVGFNDRVFQISGWPTDRGGLARRLSDVRPRGATSFYEAIVVGIEALHTTSDARRQALVLITDGNDAIPGNARRYSPGQPPLASDLDGREDAVLELIAQSETLTYAIGMGGAGIGTVNVPALKRLTDPSGGYTQVIATPSLNAVASASERIAKELRTQYVLGFEPEGKPDGKFHRVEVSVNGCRCVARTRSGFVARR
jgi:VWFA-related protein